MTFEIVPLLSDHAPAAAEIFTNHYAIQRQAAPALPEDMLDVRRVAAMIANLTGNGHGLAALQNGALVGYMGWYIVDGFRNTDRRAAYCPEWGHGVTDSAFPAAYQALYSAASVRWVEAGCQLHALTLLACDQAAHNFWFTNGFGVAVMDAIRPMRPIELTYPLRLQVRKALLEDAGALAVIEAEHWRHYAQPPTLMVPATPDDAEQFKKLIGEPDNSVWLAERDGELAGYMRFERRSHGATAIVESDQTIAITGAYVRPAFRGQRAAVALLDSALVEYAARGFERCSVDFESFNPEAYNFWPRYFQPVCYSVVRVPEAPRPPAC